jgi:hypothetical protein
MAFSLTRGCRSDAPFNFWGLVIFGLAVLVLFLGLLGYGIQRKVVFVS